MANEYTTGQKIEFLGAALSGQVPQFQQQMEQLDEKRTEAMYKDAGAAYGLFKKGNLGGIIDLANDRLSLLQRLPGSDPSDTMQVLQLSQAAQAGNLQAQSQLGQVLEAADVRGRSLGFDTSPLSSAPATFQSRHMMALAAGFAEGSPEYQDFIARGSVEEFSPGITRYRNGVVAQFGRLGGRQVANAQGNIVTGQAADDAIQSGIDSGVEEAGALAGARARETGIAERAQDLISRGQTAAEALPTINRAIELLESGDVETGGLNRFRIGAERFFGIISTDEGEISNLMGKAVLSQLRETFGAAFTAKEGQQLIDIEANLSNNPEVNLRLLKNAQSIAMSTARRAMRTAKREGDTNTAADIQEFIDGAYNLSLDPFDAQPEQDEVPQNADGVYIINTPEEFDAMPVGAQFVEVVDENGQPINPENQVLRTKNR